MRSLSSQEKCLKQESLRWLFPGSCQWSRFLEVEDNLNEGSYWAPSSFPPGASHLQSLLRNGDGHEHAGDGDASSGDDGGGDGHVKSDGDHNGRGGHGDASCGDGDRGCSDDRNWTFSLSLRVWNVNHGEVSHQML